jgi:putative ABC transport system permease protein
MRYRRLFDLRLGGRRRIDAELDAEIESHIAMRAADLVRAGMPPDQARHEAMRRFGDFGAAQRQLREGARQREAAMSHRDWLGSIRADVVYALRQFRRAPGFTVIAIATLALGVGATTSIFTLVDRVLIEPLPFPASHQLVQFEGMDSTRAATGTISQRDWQDWRRASSLASSAIYAIPRREVVVTRDSSLRLSADRVTPDFFTVLRSQFVAGRSFVEEEVVNQGPVVVISERLWRRLFDADPRLARQLRTPDRSYSIVGVIATGQEFPADVDLWFPIPSVRRVDVPRYNINWYGIGPRAPRWRCRRSRAGSSVPIRRRCMTTASP